MKGPTHLLGGLAAAVPVGLIFGLPLVVAAGLLGGLWPDLDSSETTLTNWRLKLSGGKGQKPTYLYPFRPISQVISLFTKHRGVWHSLPATLIFAVLVGLLGGPAWGVAFGAGYLSHLILDAATPAGVAFWPGTTWHLLPPKYRIQTGSHLEHLISALAAVVVLIYLFWAMGTSGPWLNPALPISTLR